MSLSMKRVKIALTGAAGQIGYALVFRLASGQVFGPNVKVDLNLIEIESALPALKGVVMELEDCAFPTLGHVLPTDSLNEGFRDVNYALLVGSMPRRKGMKRSDLLTINGNIFIPQGRAINDYAASDIKILVVGNPCNTNALIAMHAAADIPRERFFAMTALDQNRAVAQLAIKANVDVADVDHMMIWGNHSSTQYPDFFNATIKGQSAVEVIGDLNWFKRHFLPCIQKRGAAVIEARGASSAASAANGIVDSLTHLAGLGDALATYSVGCCSKGEYSIDEGLIFSYPCRTNKGHVQPVLGLPHNDYGQEKILLTLEELRQERDSVKALGLLS